VHLIPNHARAEEMLKIMGKKDVQELFVDIPADLRIKGLNLPEAEPERTLVSRLRRLLAKNRTYDSMSIFMGGGLKPQLVPASVKAVAHRQELINAYTPYQPEVSQGLLQALFEYQSLMADITQMEVVNSSMYDGLTALGEAGLMCARATKKRLRFLVPKNLSWQKRSILENYTLGAGMTIADYGYDDVTGQADVDSLRAAMGDDVCGVYVENPNYFGIFEEELEAIRDIAKEAGALFVMGIDPTTMGITTPPGLLGADIVIGEASCFGGSPAVGGPLLGLFATTEKLVRKMPGRLIGATTDADGKRGYVMTLQAREQHIRRAKATSNICSNEALLSVQAAIHLTLLGRTGLRTMGLQNLKAGAELEKTLEAGGLTKRFSGPGYNEVVTKVPAGLHEQLLAADVHGGLNLERDLDDLADCMLWGSTPVHSDWHREQLASALKVEVLA
jgi:glycine dehydrogenase subunit 1